MCARKNDNENIRLVQEYISQVRLKIQFYTQL